MAKYFSEPRVLIAFVSVKSLWQSTPFRCKNLKNILRLLEKGWEPHTKNSCCTTTLCVCFFLCSFVISFFAILEESMVYSSSSALVCNLSLRKASWQNCHWCWALPKLKTEWPPTDNHGGPIHTHLYNQLRAGSALHEHVLYLGTEILGRWSVCPVVSGKFVVSQWSATFSGWRTETLAPSNTNKMPTSVF